MLRFLYNSFGGYVINKADIYVINFGKGKMVLFVGSEDSINGLKAITSKDGKKKLVDYMIENNIYCNLCCKNEDDVADIFDMEDNNRLINSGLLIDTKLAFEAMVLKNPDKTYNGLDFIEKETGDTKEDIDNIFVDSWWLDKFEF